MADLNQQFNNLNNTKDYTSQFDPKDIEDNKIMGILAYLSWLVLIPIFAAPNSKFARFHANQGLVLAIAEIACGILNSILGWIPVIRVVSGIICFLVGIVCFVLTILGIVNVANGKAKELPVIGSIRILK